VRFIRTFLDAARIEEFPAAVSGAEIRKNEPNKKKRSRTEYVRGALRSE